MGRSEFKTKINGKPVGAMPAEKLKGSEVSAGLLRAASSTTAYSVSLDRVEQAPFPK